MKRGGGVDWRSTSCVQGLLCCVGVGLRWTSVYSPPPLNPFPSPSLAHSMVSLPEREKSSNSLEDENWKEMISYLLHFYIFPQMLPRNFCWRVACSSQCPFSKFWPFYGRPFPPLLLLRSSLLVLETEASHLCKVHFSTHFLFFPSTPCLLSYAPLSLQPAISPSLQCQNSPFFLHFFALLSYRLTRGA